MNRIAVSRLWDISNALELPVNRFFEGVATGAIRVHRDTVITRFLEKDGKPHATKNSERSASYAARMSATRR